MSTLSRIGNALALGVALAGATLATAGAAQADGPLDPVVRPVQESPKEVEAFWTAARMRNAQPMTMPGAEDGGAAQRSRSRNVPDGTGIPESPGGQQATLKTRRTAALRTPRLPGRERQRPAARWYGTELPWSNWSYGYTGSTKAVGRLFFMTPTGASSCSASVVAANVVVTAAHCVEDGASGADFWGFKFVPNVYGASQPFGSFIGRAVSAYGGWASASYNCVAGTGCSGYFPLDYAFVTLSPNASGYNVAQYTGAYGIWPNAPKSDVYHLGYPSEGSWSSNQNYPWHCKSPIQRYTAYYENRYDVGISCYDTGGSSGGPWFQTASNGVSYISSVMSHMGVVKWQNSSCRSNGCPRYGTTFFGPYFNDDTVRLLGIAKTR